MDSTQARRVSSSFALGVAARKTGVIAKKTSASKRPTAEPWALDTSNTRRDCAARECVAKISPRGGKLLVSRGATLIAFDKLRPLLRRFGACPDHGGLPSQLTECARRAGRARLLPSRVSGSAGASPSPRSPRRSVRGSVVSSAACRAPGFHRPQLSMADIAAYFSTS